MNPIGWIRWKLLAALTLIIGGFTTLGVNPLAKATVNRLGARDAGARWNVDDFAINPITGNLTVRGLDVENCAAQLASTAVTGPRQPANDGQILAAQTVQFELDMQELLRHRYCGEMKVVAPKLRFERRADGSMNLDFGTAADNAVDTGEPTDWWTQAQRWIEQIKQWNEQRQKL